jgi:hypothetical protein
MSNQFQTQTIYTFIPSAAFAAIATTEELALAEVYPVVNSVRINKVYRKASDAKRFITAGFKLTFVTKTQFVIDDQSIGSIGESTIGPMIVIDRVEDKYDDSMGAYQVAYGRDAEGNEMSESNMYSTNAYFKVGII